MFVLFSVLDEQCAGSMEGALDLPAVEHFVDGARFGRAGLWIDELSSSLLGAPDGSGAEFTAEVL
jgi:hypothetical protein